MKKFKNSFQVNGTKSLLEAFAKELESLGYISKRHYGGSQDPCIVVQWAHNSGGYGWAFGHRRDKQYTLPQDWDKVLALAAEEDLPEYVKCIENNCVHPDILGCVFKVVSWVDEKHFNSKEVRDRLKFQHCSYPLNGGVWKFEPATKEEYEVQNKKQDLQKKKWKIQEFTRTTISSNPDDGDFIIHSITDGSNIIAVGDETNHGRVREFKCRDDGIIVLLAFPLTAWAINKTEKIEEINLKKTEKKPLFVTEDGKEVFDGKYWGVDGAYVIYEFVALPPSYVNYNIQEKKYKRFSTREAAEEYVFNNGRFLSLNDVDSSISFSSRDSDAMFDKLKHLVKQRIIK